MFNIFCSCMSKIGEIILYHYFKKKDNFLYRLFFTSIFFFNMPHRIGTVNNINKFDAQFFDFSTTEGHLMDPGLRMLLEHTYEAIVDAGMNPKELQGTRTSVLTAISIPESRTFFLVNCANSQVRCMEIYKYKLFC
ncbi:hypothetical protein PUN28_019432 [Cardiocondyla obscurior]|uniref:Beta-ketoacyl synthase-like N-terminal domain-containing protein n=1 Tax=Cardiocondyla obscurior TaxID=286306 RepID=A0AAW2EFH6_9HYME